MFSKISQARVVHFVLRSLKFRPAWIVVSVVTLLFQKTNESWDYSSSM
jgi:hypothetical protein